METVAMHPLETQLDRLTAEVRQLRARAARSGEVIVDASQLLELQQAIDEANAIAGKMLDRSPRVRPQALELVRT